MAESRRFWRKSWVRFRNPDLSEAVQYLGPMKSGANPSCHPECDIGVIPNRRSVFTELNMPTRIFEYLSQGKPVIAPGTPGILDYFGPKSWCSLNWAAWMISRQKWNMSSTIQGKWRPSLS